jgi:hypothetical protein
MKKIFLSFAIMFVCASAFAQKNVVKLNVPGLLGGNYMLAYERVLNDKMSVQLAAGYINLSSSTSAWFDDSRSLDGSLNGFIVVPEFRYYVTNASKDVPRGLYAGGFARIRMVTDKVVDSGDPSDPVNYSYTDKTNTFGGGVVLGYQALIADVLSIDFFIGPQYKSKSTSRTYVDSNANDTDLAETFPIFKIKEKSGAGVRLGINVGVAF